MQCIGLHCLIPAWLKDDFLVLILWANRRKSNIHPLLEKLWFLNRTVSPKLVYEKWSRRNGLCSQHWDPN